MKWNFFYFIVISNILIFINPLLAVIPEEISRVEFFKEYEYLEKSLIYSKKLKIGERDWIYCEYYWKVFFNKKNKILAEKLYYRGHLISYWSYLYQRDGRIIRKGFHWGGIRNSVYYNMGWQSYVLKRGFSYYNERFSYQVFNSKLKLVYEEFYKNGYFESFVRYFYDSYGNYLKKLWSAQYHQRGSNYDYIFTGRPVYPYSAIN